MIIIKKKKRKFKKTVNEKPKSRKGLHEKKQKMTYWQKFFCLGWSFCSRTEIKVNNVAMNNVRCNTGV